MDPLICFMFAEFKDTKFLLKASELSHVCTSQRILEKTFQQDINFQRVFLIVFSIEKGSRKMHWDAIFVANGSYKWIWWVVYIRNVLEVSMKLFTKILYLPWTFRLNVACFQFVEVIRDVQVFSSPKVKCILSYFRYFRQNVPSIASVCPERNI